MTLLWIDDLRNLHDRWANRYAPFPPDEIVWAKNYDEVLTFLQIQGYPEDA